MANNNKEQTEEVIQDWKFLYLVKTFSRTTRKDYENYVVNAVWQRLNTLDLQPVTQQIVVHNKKRYLIDLYFPQVNVAIECDEPFHLGQKDDDQTREKSIEKEMSAVVAGKDLVFKRIKINEGLDKVNAQIDDAVAEILRRKKEMNVAPWQLINDPQKFVAEKGALRVSDNLHFATIAQIANCFGKQYKIMQKCFFPVGKGEYKLWCPKLALKDDDGKDIAASRSGWLNTISEDWTEINEWQSIDSKNQTADKAKRLVFAKSKDYLGMNCYRFVGVYQVDEIDTTFEKHVYRRISDEIKVSDVL